jgi:hypothetical protein
MSYVLSACRDSDNFSDDLFDLYFNYIESLKVLISESAYLTASNVNWYQFGTQSPHDGYLDTLIVKDHFIDSDDSVSYCNIIIILECENEGRRSLKKICYKHVVQYLFCNDSAFDHRDWRYDEFSLYKPGFFKHEIEWGDGARWLICAKEIEVVHNFLK